MIYFDTCATSLQKPPQVAEAVASAIGTMANAGRSFYPAAMQAGRAVLATRMQIAQLVSLQNPLGVAFTSGATESLNLVLSSLITAQDGVITTVLEHNSVLRPLYHIGCPLSFIPCDESGDLILNNLEDLLQSNTRFLVCTHGSNLTGSVTNTKRLMEFCRLHEIVFILDVAQTLGSIPVHADMADVLCFTGHKALLGPQGTGGIIAKSGMKFPLVKTGGAGASSFEKHQALSMPDVFEAGTPNAHSLAGLQKGAEYICEQGVAKLAAKEQTLLKAFVQGAYNIEGVRLYGPSKTTCFGRLPIAALGIRDLSAEDVALRLWDEWEIATRPGAHCAPLVHRHFGTMHQGMVRFSFGCFNTMDEIQQALHALAKIAA